MDNDSYQLSIPIFPVVSAEVISYFDNMNSEGMAVTQDN